SRTAYSPISAKRLANGNTFVVCRNHLLELDPKGKEVFNIPLSGNMITAARKWPNGDITYLTSAGLFTRLDSKGKAVKAFSIPTAQRGATYVEILPNDRVLVSEFDQGYRLVEYDSRGQELRHISLPTFVSSFQRLANGSTLLVTSSSQILEVDRTGKTVWELKAPNLRPHRARRLEPTSN